MTGEGRARSMKDAVLDVVAQTGPVGATWFEVGDVLGVHHGTASGALSFLHEEGRLARLREKRGRSRVYVLPEHTLGRETEPHGRRPCPHCGL